MTRQLRLFPDISPSRVPGNGDASLADLAMELSAVDEMAAVTHRFHTRQEFLTLLRFMAGFPNYSVFNALLLYTQNPSAKFVATARTWTRKFRRRPKANSRPLIILAPMAPILFVFDINDTEGSPAPPELLTPPEIKPTLLEKKYDQTLHNCRIQGIAVHETVLNTIAPETAGRLTPALRKKYNDFNLKKDANYLVLLDKNQSRQDRFAALAYELGHIFCGHLGIDRQAWWPERRDLNISGEEIEAESVAYLVCRRMGLKAASRKFLSDDPAKDPQMPAVSLNAIIQAVTYVEDMAKAPWKKPPRSSRY